jgi:hypothetical protein
MAKVIIVKAIDITKQSNGLGGWELSYYGNKKWHCRTLQNIDTLPLDTAVAQFVAYLNSIPIIS